MACNGNRIEAVVACPFEFPFSELELGGEVSVMVVVAPPPLPPLASFELDEAVADDDAAPLAAAFPAAPFAMIVTVAGLDEFVLVAVAVAVDV